MREEELRFVLGGFLRVRAVFESLIFEQVK